MSNAPEDTPLETLAYVGGSRWRIETEFETEKSDVGLDEYETRTWPGWHRHMAMCLLAGAFLLSLQQDWGKKMPLLTRSQVYRVVREMLPRERFGPNELLRWLGETQDSNERARRSHAKRRAALRTSPEILPRTVVVILDHHRHCGDSLLGLRVADAAPELRRVGGIFAASAIAGAEAAGMQQIEDMSDADIAEVRESAQLYGTVQTQPPD